MNSISLEIAQQLREQFAQNQFVNVCADFEDLYQNQPDVILDDETLKVVAVSYFRTAKKQSCLSILDKMSSDILAQDFFLSEIRAECSFDLNKLHEAYAYFHQAIELNPKLVSARYKKMMLQVRLFDEFDPRDLRINLENAKAGKRQQWLRDIAYLLYQQGRFDEANQCLVELSKIGGKFHFLDRITFNSLQSANSDEQSNVLKQQQNVEHIATKFVHNTARHLVVVLATHHTHAFANYKFGEKFDLLFMADLTSSYYVFLLHDCVQKILDKDKEHQYDSISLVGASKAGTGAMIIYQELIKQYSRPVNVIAFSPPFDLYPFNPNLLIPSYQHLSKLFDVHPVAKHLFKNTALPNKLVAREQDKVLVIYGTGYEMDAKEVSNITKEQGIIVKPLAYSGHSTSIPYTIPDNKTLDDLKRIYANLADLPDEDFQALGGGKTVDLVDEIWQLYQDPEVSLRWLLEDMTKSC